MGRLPKQAPKKGRGKAAAAGAAIACSVLPTTSAALQAHVSSRSCYLSDVEMHRTLRKMFPQEWLVGVQLPPLEDIANGSAFAEWRTWSAENSVYAASIQAPVRSKGREAAFLGVQRGATGSKHSIDAVVGFGMCH